MNSCMFVGNLGNDAELTQAGNSQVCKFSVATSTGFGDKKANMWVACNLWGKRGQSLQQYLSKGTKVLVVGELSENEYNGKKYLNLNVNQVELLGERQQGGQQQGDQSYGQPAQQQQGGQSYGQHVQQPAQQPAQQGQTGGQGAFNPFDSLNGNVF